MPRHHKRLDIQGLRALAVALVVTYHVWPAALPGGFVGVDLFFVISGYLIIGSLTREVERSSTVDLVGFYIRRIRRLLPAASAAISVTLVLCFVVLEDSQLLRNLEDALAAALQVANWRFAFGPDSYAQATASVSPFQHFWSLAVEEQFYIVVPLLMLGVALMVRRTSWKVIPTVLLMLGVIGLASLVWSIVQTATTPSIAYFSTLARAWELVLGGVAAIVLRRAVLSRGSARVAGIFGLTLVFASAALMTTSMSFPGALALVPVAGAVLLLVAGSGDQPGVVSAALSTRPMVWLGDISYSLYLWHWPIVVAALALGGRPLGLLDGPAVVAASLLVAWASDRFVERPFRGATVSGGTRSGRRRRVRILVSAGAVTASLVALGGVPLTIVNAQIAAVADASAGDYPGALAFDGAPVPTGMPISPDLRAAHGDLPLVFRDNCISQDLTTADAARDPTTCHYGASSATRQVALVGDSHAAVLSTPLEELATQHGFGLTAYLRNGCPFTLLAPIGLGECQDQNRRTLDLLLRERPDVVVIASMSPFGYRAALGWGWKSFDQALGGYRETVSVLVDAAMQVVVVRDTPYMPFSPPDCVASGADCSLSRSLAAEQRDPLAEVAAGIPEATVLDLTDHLCGDTCDSVVGNVLVYRDNHLTDTYARSLQSEMDTVFQSVAVWRSGS